MGQNNSSRRTHRFFLRKSFSKKAGSSLPQSADDLSFPIELPSSPPSLPVELILHFISFMNLKTLISSRRVCKEWQSIIPFADLHPTRRRLYLLFCSMVRHRRFTETRKWTANHLKPFDRECYLESLLSQYNAIPEEFRVWILEWPAKLAVGCMWPGLPFTSCQVTSFERRYGVNWMGYTPPQLSAIVYRHGRHEREVKYIPGLLLWRDDFYTHWLVFEEEADLFGRVFILECGKDESPSIIPASHNKEPGTWHEDWIAYQQHQWEDFLDTASRYEIRELRERGEGRNRGVKYSDMGLSINAVEINLGGQPGWDLPCAPWIRRDEDVFVRFLMAALG